MKRCIFLLTIGILGLTACGRQVSPTQAAPTNTLAAAAATPQRTVAECTAQSQPAPEMIAEGEHVTGAEEGYTVTIIIYNDFACEDCKSTEGTVLTAVAAYPEDVRLVFRHYADTQNPLSMLAAEAAEAAGLQGKFWEMQYTLYNLQDEWLSLDDVAFQAWLEAQAADLGLDIDQFKTDMINPNVAALITEETQQAQVLSERVAPLVLVNGNPVPSYVDTVGSFYYWLENLMIPAGKLVNMQFTNCPQMSIDLDKQYTATLHTNKGDIVLALYADKAPFAVNSFVFLAQHDFYDNNSFFQVIPGELALTGDPTNMGWGNPGYLYSLEVGSEDAFDRPGLVAMWNSGPTSNGSQFFITYAPLPQFNGRYTIIGEVISGMEVLNSLTPRNAQLDPLAPPGDMIEDVSIEAK